MQRRFLLHVVVRKRPAVLQLLPRKNEALLVGGDPLLVLDFALDHVNRVARLDFERDSFSGQVLHKHLHAVQLLNRDARVLRTAVYKRWHNACL
jgi:hypothetical protein